MKKQGFNDFQSTLQVVHSN